MAQVCQLVWQEWEAGEHCIVRLCPLQQVFRPLVLLVCCFSSALSIPKCFHWPSRMGSPLRKKLVRNCLNAKIVTSMEFMLVARVIFVGLIPESSWTKFLLHALTGSFYAVLEIINNSSLC